MNGFNYQKYLIFAAIQKRSCGRVARQSSAKASTPVRIWSGPHFTLSFSAWGGIFFKIMAPKILHWIGLTACIVLIVSCFLPWAYFADAHIANEADRTFTGFYSYGNNYGKPGMLLVAIGLIAFTLMVLPKIWAKRTNLFVCALGVGYAVKSYILYTSCYNAYCPEKKTAIFLMLAAMVIMLVASAFPHLALKEDNSKKPE